MFAPSCRAWIVKKSSVGTTATTGWAPACTTRLTAVAVSQSRIQSPTGLKPAPPPLSTAGRAAGFTPTLGQTVAEETLLSTFDVDIIPPEALMFQAGYLTVDSVWKIPGRQEFTLKYPNKEVQASLNDSLLKHWVGGLSIPGRQISQLYRVLAANDLPALKAAVPRLLRHHPHDWYRNSPIAQYGAITPASSTATSRRWAWTSLEDTTNHGRIDMTVLFNGHVHLRVQGGRCHPRGHALQQIKDRGYADKYRARANLSTSSA